MKPGIVLGITMGDVGGIGPEVALKAIHGARWPKRLRFVLVGSASVARQLARTLHLPPSESIPSLQSRPAGRIGVWEPLGCTRPKARPGRVSVAAARASIEWVRAGVEACGNGWMDGIVTAPICKEGLKRAQCDTPGHTEFLAELTGTKRYAMMLTGGGLRVVLVTRHIALRKVAEAVSIPAIVEAAELAAEGLKWLGVRNRRVGICALNPHAGDGGAIGREETDVVRPAVRMLRQRGIPVAGPVPADVIFHKALNGEYGAVVAMYHDQGLGPLKMLAFESGVNVTLGLPIVRTSPDHGTAFDIAGKGVANPSSMIEAIKLAYRLAGKPNPWRHRRLNRV